MSLSTAVFPSAGLAEPVLDSAARDAPSVTLAQVQAGAGLLTRFDRSYLVPAEVFARFAQELRRRHGVRALEMDGRRLFHYHSVYYDTPGLLSHHDHCQGRRRRFKIRERLYEDTGERQLEIKLKSPRGETVKRRRPLHPGEPALGSTGQAFLAEVLGVEYGMPLPRRLSPALVTDYVRATFAADDLRVTCDIALVCRDPRTGVTASANADLVLVETKSSGSLTAADRLLHTYGVREASFTKYCGALAVLRPGLPAHRWRRAVRSVFPYGAPAASERRPVRPPWVLFPDVR